MFSGSALACIALAGLVVLLAQPLSAEALIYNSQTQDPKQIVSEGSSSGNETAQGHLGQSNATAVIEIANASTEKPVTEPTTYVATAYSLRGRTASGRFVSRGLIAADPRVLPLGSRVRLDAGAYSGEYLVADTGALVKGRRIDIWTPSSKEAMKFGKRKVKLTVLSYGGKRKSAQARATVTGSK